MGEPSTAPGRVEGVGQPVLSFEQCFILFCNFPLVFAFVVGGLGFEFCVFVAGWRHALRSEWPFIIIIVIGPGVMLIYNYYGSTMTTNNLAKAKSTHILHTSTIHILLYPPPPPSKSSSMVRGLPMSKGLLLAFSAPLLSRGDFGRQKGGGRPRHKATGV